MVRQGTIRCSKLYISLSVTQMDTELKYSDLRTSVGDPIFGKVIGQ